MNENTDSYYESKKSATALMLPKSLVSSAFVNNASSRPARWSPYEDNGGTCAAISGKGFVIIAADTRLNGDFCIHSRDDDSKLFKLTNNTWMASAGMQADRLQLQQVIKYKIEWYIYNNCGCPTASSGASNGNNNNNNSSNNSSSIITSMGFTRNGPTTRATAQLLSTLLYQRRFFPYYTFNIIAGLDEETGDGVCFSYDAVGCTEPLSYGTTGSASSIIEPLLDCLIMRRNMTSTQEELQRQFNSGVSSMGNVVPYDMTKDEALLLLKNAFTGAGERDIYTGDCVRFVILTSAGTEIQYMPLRKD